MRKINIFENLSNIFWLFIPLLIFWVYIRQNLNILAFQRVAGVSDMINPSQLVIDDYDWQGNGLVTFWFDDAWLNQYEKGYRILNKYGLIGAVAVPTRHVGYEAYMNWNQIRKLHQKGWEIVSHSRNHDCDLMVKSSQEAKNEIVGGKIDLAREGIISHIYVAPCGRTNDWINQIVKDNFTAQRIVEPGINFLPTKDKYGLKIRNVESSTTINDVRKWVKEAEYARAWLIFMFHQVSEDELSLSVNPKLLEEIILEIKNSKLSVVLPTEALSIK